MSSITNPRRAYQESAALGAGPRRLTVMLYDQILHDVSRAELAIKNHRADLCATEIGHAVAVIGYLQAMLHREAGAEVARNLGSYTMLRERLMEAQVRSSRQILSQLRQQLVEARDAWMD